MSDHAATSDCDLQRLPLGLCQNGQAVASTALIQTDNGKSSRESCLEFPPDRYFSYEQVGGVAAEPLGMAPERSKLKQLVRSTILWNWRIETSHDQWGPPLSRLTRTWWCQVNHCCHSKMKYRIKNGVEAENCEIAANNLKIPDSGFHFSSLLCNAKSHFNWWAPFKTLNSVKQYW